MYPCLPILFGFGSTCILLVRLVEEKVIVLLPASVGYHCRTPDGDFLTGTVCKATIIQLQCSFVLLHAFLSFLVIAAHIVEPVNVLLQIRKEEL